MIDGKFMGYAKTLGRVNNDMVEKKVVNVGSATLIIGGSAVGAYIGFKLGGPQGALVGALVCSFVGALAAGYIKKLKVIWHPDGKVEVDVETRF